MAGPLPVGDAGTAVIKGALHAQGRIPSPAVRLPLLPAHRDTVSAATSLLSQIDRTAATASL